MDKKGIANYVMCILQKTFDALDDAYENNLEDQKTNANSHLIFPTYSGKNGNYRVSEQELRFEFIHQFLKSQEENGGIHRSYIILLRRQRKRSTVFQSLRTLPNLMMVILKKIQQENQPNLM